VVAFGYQHLDMPVMLQSVVNCGPKGTNRNTHHFGIPAVGIERVLVPWSFCNQAVEVQKIA
jgi:hypothetical protein